MKDNTVCSIFGETMIRQTRATLAVKENASVEGFTRDKGEK